MANIMTKRGTHDNIVTYEHMCDRHDDLQNIPKSQIALGSTAIVLRDDGDQLGVYMADSSKEWVPLLTMGNDSGSSTPAPVDLLRVLSSGDYDADTHIPTVENPEINVIYLVPSASESDNNLFDEWIYTGTEWERFGGVSAGGASVQADWNQSDENANDYIKNRPNIKKGSSITGVVEGMLGNIASGAYSHAEGGNYMEDDGDGYEASYPTTASGLAAHAEGVQTIASGQYTHAEGYRTSANGNISHAEGFATEASGDHAHAEGTTSHASGQHAHAEGYMTYAVGTSSHAEGSQSKASQEGAHAEGYNSLSNEKYSHAEGYFTITFDTAAHAEGTSSIASGTGSHAEGGNDYPLFNIVLSGEANARTYTINGNIPSILTSTSGSFYSIIDTNEKISAQIDSIDTTAKTITVKKTLSSFAITNKRYMLLCGSVAAGTGAHAEGKSIATGNYSHAEGLGTIAAGSAQHVSGMYNVIDDSNYAEIVGNGLTDAETDRSNARTLNWSGNEWLAGTLTVSTDPTEDMQVATKKYVDGKKLKNTLDGSGTGATTLGGNSAGRATGQNSVAESSGSATGRNSHAEGWAARATSTAAHAEGYFAQATGSYSHAEGGYSAVDTIFLTGAAGATTYTYTPDKTIIDFVTNDNLVINYNGTIYYVNAVDKTAHTITMASTISSNTALTNAEATWGTYSLAMGSMSHAEGQSLSKGRASHSEGSITTAAGNYSHAEGYKTAANKECAHSEGCLTIASGLYSHVEGHVTLAAGENSHAEGYTTNARGKSSHSEGSEGGASGDYAHSEGVYCSAEADAAHAEGYCMVAKGKYSHAEGYGSFSKKTYEGIGYDCGTVGQAAHAEGSLTLAIGENSHAECEDTVAYGKGSHAEGGSTVASGNNSHAEGNSTIASGLATHVFGTFNINSNVSAAETPDTKGTMVEIVGNGTADDARSNARTLDWSGNESLSGSLTCQNSITIGNTTITEAQLQSLLALLS